MISFCDRCKTPDRRGGASAERRKFHKIEECGFLSKAASPFCRGLFL